VIEIRVGPEILLIADASWMPGVSTNEFELVVVFGPTGRQNLNVVLTVGTQEVECGNYDSLILVNTHWVTPMMWVVIPALSVSVVVLGVYTRRKGSRVVSLQKAMNAEISEDYQEAFDSYCKHRLPKSASRVAIKEDLPEEMISQLMQVFGNAVTRDLEVLANKAALKGEYNRAARVYFLIGQTDRGTTYKTMDELSTGNLQDAIITFRDVASLENAGFSVNLLEYLKLSDKATRDEFVAGSKEPLLRLATRFKLQASSQDLLIEIVGDDVEPEFLATILMNMGRSDEAAELVIGQKTVPKMVELTMTLDQNYRNTVAPVVVESITSTHKPKQVAKYVTSIELSDNALEAAVSPMIRELIQNPTNKDLITSLKQISGASQAGSIQSIEDAVNAMQTIIETSEEQGISLDEVGSSSLLPVIASLTDQTLAENLISKIENQLLKGHSPGSADIGALAELVYGLRLATYRNQYLSSQIQMKFTSYENSLVNRLTEAYHGAFITSTLALEGEDWLDRSANSVANNLLAVSPLHDKISIAKASFRAMQRATGNILKTFIHNSIDAEELQGLVDELMNNSLTRDRILRRHMKYQLDQHGRRVYAPDMNAAFDEAITEVLRRWKPQSISALKHGTFRAALSVVHMVMNLDSPKKELRDITVILLNDSRPIYNEIKPVLKGLIQSLLDHFDREELTTILNEVRLPVRLIDEP
jgi:hypothetical protein